ncbi:hypothetical protein [Psychroflexus aurantiacus]|uniref:hypothetical protein n=1 Tax=Psychroflexus aurantiacus TaxID=2709310 RepID=UPI0013D8EB2A|nr:hypothetical protein [Psychroflexus aurantiacus]
MEEITEIKIEDNNTNKKKENAIAVLDFQVKTNTQNIQVIMILKIIEDEIYFTFTNYFF